MCLLSVSHCFGLLSVQSFQSGRYLRIMPLNFPALQFEYRAKKLRNEDSILRGIRNRHKAQVRWDKVLFCSSHVFLFN